MMKATADNSIIKDICRDIEENIHEILYVEQAAARFGMNHWRLRVLFHAAAGCTVQEFLNRARIKKLKELILSCPAETPLCEFALQAGFEYDSSLANFIRRQTGMTLSRFRENVLAENQ